MFDGLGDGGFQRWEAELVDYPLGHRVCTHCKRYWETDARTIGGRPVGSVALKLEWPVGSASGPRRAEEGDWWSVLRDAWESEEPDWWLTFLLRAGAVRPEVGPEGAGADAQALALQSAVRRREETWREFLLRRPRHRQRCPECKKDALVYAELDRAGEGKAVQFRPAQPRRRPRRNRNLIEELAAFCSIANTDLEASARAARQFVERYGPLPICVHGAIMAQTDDEKSTPAALRSILAQTDDEKGRPAAASLSAIPGGLAATRSLLGQDAVCGCATIQNPLPVLYLRHFAGVVSYGLDLSSHDDGSESWRRQVATFKRLVEGWFDRDGARPRLRPEGGRWVVSYEGGGILGELATAILLHPGGPIQRERRCAECGRPFKTPSRPKRGRPPLHCKPCRDAGVPARNQMRRSRERAKGETAKK